MNKPDCINFALKILANKSYSIYQIKQKLLNKQYSVNEIDSAIGYLTQRGYISDHKFAKNLFNKYYNSPKYGYYKIRAKLLECGLEPDIVNNTLADYNFQDDYKRALILLQKNGMLAADQQKIARMLYSKGFNSSTIYQVFEHILKKI